MFTMCARNFFILKKNSFAHDIQCYHNFMKKSMIILRIWLEFVTNDNKSAEKMLDYRISSAVKIIPLAA